MSTVGLVKETSIYLFSTSNLSGQIINADTEWKSQIIYTVPDMIVDDEDIEYIEYGVNNAQIPVSFYTINDTNNRMSIYYPNTLTTVNYDLDYGNYNTTYYIQQMNLLTPVGMVITLNTYNSKFTFTYTQPFTLLATSSQHKICGFLNNTSSILSSSSYVVNCPRVCNFLSLPRVIIRCDELSANQVVGGDNGNNILVCIPNNSRPNGIITYDNTNNQMFLFSKPTLSRFIISFTDDYGNLLNFNGVISYFSLQFNIYRTFKEKVPSFKSILTSVNLETLKRLQQSKQNKKIITNT